MTWLFTQVWLFSVAAFLLGALITWMLFVRPLQRRLTEVTEYERYVDEVDYGDHGSRVEGGEAESTAFDLLRLEPDDEPVAVEACDEPDDSSPGSYEVEPSAERTQRVVPVDPPMPHSQRDEQVETSLLEAVEAEPRAARKTDRRGMSVGEWPEPVRTSPTAPPEVDYAATERVDPERTDKGLSDKARADADPGSTEWAGTVHAGTAQAGTDPAGAEPAGAETVETVDDGGSDWFRRSGSDADQQGAERGAAAVPGAADSGVADPSAANPSHAARDREDWTDVFDDVTARELRPVAKDFAPFGVPTPMVEPSKSLFEPIDEDESQAKQESGNDKDQSREDTAAEPGLGVTTSLPHAEPEAEPDKDVAEPTPLPRRTPGAGPRPGRQNLGGRAKSQAESKPQRKRAAGGVAGDGGQLVKGHFASRLYHTPDSPHYDGIVAEVSFGTASEAEQAGFEPWDGWHRN